MTLIASSRSYLFLAFMVTACTPASMDPPGADDDGAVAHPGTFYVAPDGNDTWTGGLADPATDDGPLATLDAARDAVRLYKRQHPDLPATVLVRGGTYHLEDTLELTAEDSGTAAAPITWAAFDGETPVISGGMRIEGWTQSGASYVAKIDPARFPARGFEQLFADGVRKLTPRLTPGYMHLIAVTTTDPNDPNCRVPADPTTYWCADRFKIRPEDRAAWASLGAITPGEVEVDMFEKWTMAKLRVASVVGDLVTFTGATFQAPSAQSHSYGMLQGHRYVVENVRGRATPGTWFLDVMASPWTLTYTPGPADRDPNSAEIVVPRLATLVAAHDLAYVTFRGLTFMHDNFIVPDAGIAEQQAAPGIAAALSFVNAQHVTFDHPTLAHLGAWGLEFITDDARTGEAHDDRIVGATIYDAGTGGIRIGQMVRREDNDTHVTHHVRVEDSIVAGFGRIIPNGIGTGIWIGDSHDNVVTHNDVYDSYNGGIGVCVPTDATCKGSAGSGGAFNNEISLNRIHDMGQGVTDDIGCIYVATEAAVGNKVIGNVCHDVVDAALGGQPGGDTDGYGGNGIYLDNSTHGVEVASNLVYRVTQAAVINNHGSQVSSDAPNDVHDNILAFAGLGAIQRTLESPGAVHFVSFHNNIVVLDRGNVQRRWSFPSGDKSAWYCWNHPCSDLYDFHSNLYFRTDRDVATDPAAFVVTAQDGTGTTMSFATWQTTQGEDAGSVVRDPQLANPAAGDFTIGNQQAAAAIGFTAFDPSLAGAPASTHRPGPVPATFVTTVVPASVF